MTTSDELIWEKTSCSYCGSSLCDPAFSGPDRLHGLPGLFHLQRCRQCGVLRQEPRLAWETLSTYYPEDYAAYNYNDSEKDSRWKRGVDNYGNVKRRRYVEKYQPGGRLLEVGCGTGAFLHEVVRSGKWQSEGLEPSPQAAGFAARTLSIPIHQGRLSEVDLQSASFDAIVLWCVLEHLSSPVQDLLYIYSLLKPGGWLFFSIPNLESLEAKIFGRFWSGWDLPRHLYIFPRASIRRLLKEMGFDRISIRSISSSYNQLGHSLDFWSQTWAASHPNTRRLLLNAYRSWFGRVAFLLPLALLDRLNLSTNITFAARKLPSYSDNG